MAALSTRVTLTLIDRYKNEARIIFHVAAGIVDPNDATVQAIVSAINACCNPVGLHIELSQVNQPTGSVTTGYDYVTIDKAVFPAIDEDGQPHNFKVPAPDATIFQTDSKDVNFTNANVLAYKAAVTTYAMGRGGSPVSMLTYGYRDANRKLLK